MQITLKFFHVNLHPHVSAMLHFQFSLVKIVWSLVIIILNFTCFVRFESLFLVEDKHDLLIFQVFYSSFLWINGYWISFLEIQLESLFISYVL